MNFESLLEKIEQQAQQLVWWKQEQITRGEDVINDPTKGERSWIIPKTTGEFIFQQLTSREAKNVLELGTSIGYSTLWIAHAVAPNNGQVYTIEQSINKIPVAQQNFAESPYEKNITLYQGSILEVIKNFPESVKFDTVFMDADRGHYHEYFPFIKKHLTKDALIIADNAENMEKRMRPFLELLNNEGYDYTIHPIDNGLLLAHHRSGGIL